MTMDGPKDGGPPGAAASSSSAGPQQEGPGPALAAAREEMGVSAREIADALNLPLKVVEGIEANDASKLPPTAFARGYVRSYAKLFDLDADALVSAYEDMVGETHTAEVVVVPSPEARGMVSFFSAQPPLFWAVSAGVALVLVLLIVWLASGGDDVGSSAGADASSAADRNVAQTDSRTPGEVSDDDRVVYEPDLPIEALAQDEPVGLSADDAASEANTEDSAASFETEPVTAAEPASQRRLTAEGDDTLGIGFSEDSWLVIRDGEGRKLYSNLGRRGSELTFVGQAPFRLVIGYAPGATVRFNGDAVALAPHTRNDVAKLFLGQ